METIVAYAFHDSLPEGRASVALEVHARAIEFEIAGEHKLLPFAGLSLYWGGANKRLLFLSHRDFPNWAIATSDYKLLDLLTTTQHQDITRQVHVLRRQSSHARLQTAGILVAIFLALYSIWAFRGPLLAAAVWVVPISVEEKVGTIVHAQVTSGKQTFHAEEIARAFADFAAPLTVVFSQTGYTPKLMLVRSDDLNAFAMPGGYVVVNSAVILRSESAEEVYGVLAHEFAHVTERHVLKNLVSSLGVYATFSLLLGDAVGVFAGVGTAAPYILTMTFSRSYEREADERGFEFLVRAKIDPVGMAVFFERIAKESSQVQGMADTYLSYFNSHPSTEERISNLKSLRQNLISDPSAVIVFEDFSDRYQKLKTALQGAATNVTKES